MRQVFKHILSKLLRKEEQLRHVYHRCCETPLDIFIDVLVNRNLSRLVKSGYFSAKELESAWQKLWFEYCDLSGSPEYRQLFGMIKEAGYLEGKLMVIRLALQNMASTHDNGCVNLLYNYGYKYPFDKSNPQEFLRDIQRVVDKSKTIELLITQTRGQIDKINQKSKGETVREEWFDNYLVGLSKYMGYRINRKVITISEFVRMRKMYELEAGHFKAQTSKQPV